MGILAMDITSRWPDLVVSDEFEDDRVPPETSLKASVLFFSLRVCLGRH